jgi:hypothetical protein
VTSKKQFVHLLECERMYTSTAFANVVSMVVVIIRIRSEESDLRKGVCKADASLVSRNSKKTGPIRNTPLKT